MGVTERSLGVARGSSEVISREQYQPPPLQLSLHPFCHPHPHCWVEEYRGEGGKGGQGWQWKNRLRWRSKKLWPVTSHQPWYSVHPDQNSCIQPTSHSSGSLGKQQLVGLLAIAHLIEPGLGRTWGERGGAVEGLIARMNRLMGRGCPR